MSVRSLGPGDIESLLLPFCPEPASLLLDQLAVYLDLLLRWNAKTNLTGIREPAEIVQRHFGESLFAASFLYEAETLLDFGSGAGFPGLPVALSRPEIAVTLAESQHKKNSFLQEVVRILGLSVDVWSGRVEDLPPARSFDCVTLRAVDRMADALVLASRRASKQILVLTTHIEADLLQDTHTFEEVRRVPIPGSNRGIVLHLAPPSVPRGT